MDHSNFNNNRIDFFQKYYKMAINLSFPFVVEGVLLVSYDWCLLEVKFLFFVF